VSDQLVHAVEPVFWMVRLAPNWLELCGEMVYVTLQAAAARAAGAIRISNMAASTATNPLKRLALVLLQGLVRYVESKCMVFLSRDADWGHAAFLPENSREGGSLSGCTMGPDAQLPCLEV
jgi:hypothetical protein